MNMRTPNGDQAGICDAGVYVSRMTLPAYEQFIAPLLLALERPLLE